MTAYNELRVFGIYIEQAHNRIEINFSSTKEPCVSVCQGDGPDRDGFYRQMGVLIDRKLSIDFLAIGCHYKKELVRNRQELHEGLIKGKVYSGRDFVGDLLGDVVGVLFGQLDMIDVDILGRQSGNNFGTFKPTVC